MLSLRDNISCNFALVLSLVYAKYTSQQRRANLLANIAAHCLGQLFSKFLDPGDSSNGRTPVFGTGYVGSIPAPPATFYPSAND